ncbi:MAG: DUF1080 domain-containing protein [Phycisphaerales bacterium]|nr:DUF1080 domain-containing protein [Phycisphaerales bacterium]
MRHATRTLLPALVPALLLGSAYNTAMAQGVGYDDTPQLPGQKWKVHDRMRPNPPVVDPGPARDPAPAPSDATVLFDGKNLDAWQTADGGTAGWTLLPDGAMQVKPGAGDIMTKEHFGDCQLHIEWATPKTPVGESQERGNSGVFFFGRYEVQVLDSYDNKTYADGQAGALYGQYPPLVNASRGPGEWQTYDIVFEAPVFDGDKVVKPAYATVIHNGVVVQNHRALIGSTLHRAVGTYTPHEPTGEIKLQDHGNPTRYRNIWIRSIDPASQGDGSSGSAKAGS